MLLMIYVIFTILSFKFFSTYIVEERDSMSISILIIMAVSWPIVYIVFLILAMKKLWRKIK